MKKFFTYSAVIACIIGCAGTTISSLLTGAVSTVLFFGGIMVGLCGIAFAGVVAQIEKNEYTKKQDFETSAYKSTENIFNKDKNFEKHAKQTLNMDASKNPDDKEITK